MQSVVIQRPALGCARSAQCAPRQGSPACSSALATSRQRSSRLRAAPEGGAEPAAAPEAAPAPEQPEQPENVFYEGSGSNAELAVSLLLGATVLYLPLTMASLGRRLWIQYRFTDRRLVVTTNSPLVKREVQVEYSRIREIRTAPRAFGLWGDMVVFLKDGSRLELVGLERCQEIRDYIEGRLLEA